MTDVHTSPGGAPSMKADASSMVEAILQRVEAAQEMDRDEDGRKSAAVWNGALR